MASESCVEKHLADQLLIYMALSGTRSVMRVQEISSHILTNAWAIRQFLPELQINFNGNEGESGTVEVIPPSAS